MEHHSLLIDPPELSRKILILTALPVEYRAVREYLTSLREIETDDGTIFERGKFKVGLNDVDIYLGQCGIGNIKSALATEKGIKTLNPSLILFVGIAGGIKDVAKGDVVIASKINTYESAKDSNGLQSRPNGSQCTYSIVKRATHEATVRDWRCEKTGRDFTVKVGGICTGEKVLADTSSEYFKFIKEHYNDSLAIEMEAQGFLEAIHSNNFDFFGVIRGVSDLLDNKDTTDNDGFQEIASKHASFFAFELLPKIWQYVKPKISSQSGIKISFAEHLTADQIQQVVAQIQEITKDMSINLETVIYGSTNLYLKVSESSLEKVIGIIASGEIEHTTGFKVKSWKEYLPAIQEVPMMLEFEKIRQSNDAYLLQIFDSLKNGIDIWNVDSFLGAEDTRININCAMTLRFNDYYDYISTNKITLVGRGHEKSQRKSLFDLIRYQDDLGEKTKYASKYWTTKPNFSAFKNDVESNKIAVFRTSLNHIGAFGSFMISAASRHQSGMSNEIASQMTELFTNTEGYIVIHTNDLETKFDIEKVVFNSFKMLTLDELALKK